jgi:hypothetical protein
MSHIEMRANDDSYVDRFFPDDEPPELGTFWGHMEPQTMGDPCPICGGTEFYCAHMVERILSVEGDAIWRAVAELYEIWYKLSPTSPLRGEAIQRLLDAWDRMLG